MQADVCSAHYMPRFRGACRGIEQTEAWKVGYYANAVFQAE